MLNRIVSCYALFVFSGKDSVLSRYNAGMTSGTSSFFGDLRYEREKYATKKRFLPLGEMI